MIEECPITRTDELLGDLLGALPLLCAATRSAAATPREDHFVNQVEQEFGKTNPNAPAALFRFAFLVGRLVCHLNRSWSSLVGIAGRLTAARST
jgi:hypothetical protein